MVLKLGGAVSQGPLVQGWRINHVTGSLGWQGKSLSRNHV